MAETTDKKSKKRENVAINEEEDLVEANQTKKNKKLKKSKKDETDEEVVQPDTKSPVKASKIKQLSPTTDKKSKRKSSDNEESEASGSHKHSKKKKKMKAHDEEEISGSKEEEILKTIMPIEEEDNDHHVEPHPKEETGDTWTPEDYMELITRMEAQVPKNDTVNFDNRVRRLEWEKIRFGSNSADKCYEKWKLIRSKVRHFRLLSEVLQDAKQWAKEPWSAPLSKKKNRHPDQPPRPLSSFMLFYMDKKNKIMKRNPTLKLTEISRIIGEKYKTLSEGKKAYYTEKAKFMQQEYKENLSKFYEKHPEMVKTGKKKQPINFKPLPPVKHYIKDKLQKHQHDDNFNQHDLSEKYRDAWKSLSLKKKAYWIRKAKDEEEKYLEQISEDPAHYGEDMTRTYRSVISKDDNAILDRLAGKPDKPPNSAYSLFSRLMLQDKDINYVEGNPKNRMKEIANKWKEVPEEQKKAYAEKVQHMHEAYKLEFANYLESLPEDKKAEELAKVVPKRRAAAKSKPKPAKEIASTNSDQGLFKNEPENPPSTAWDLFKNKFIKKNSHLPNKVAFKQAAELWKNLPRQETEKYKKKHKHLKDKYLSDFDAFLKSLNEDELKQFASIKQSRIIDSHVESVEEESSVDDDDEEEEDSSVISNSEESNDSGVSEDEL